MAAAREEAAVSGHHTDAQAGVPCILRASRGAPDCRSSVHSYLNTPFAFFLLDTPCAMAVTCSREPVYGSSVFASDADSCGKLT